MSAAVFVLAFVLAACSGGEAKKVVAAKSNAAQDEQTMSFPEEPTTTIAAPVTTTTVVPTTTAVPVPTTMGSFSVKSVTITMETCRDGYPPHGNSGATFGCVGKFVARLNPGLGGTVKWRADWVWWRGCNNPMEPGLLKTDGVIDVPTGATEIEGVLETYTEMDLNAPIVNGKPAKFTPTIQVLFTEGAVGSSAKTPFWSEEAHCLPDA